MLLDLGVSLASASASISAFTFSCPTQWLCSHQDRGYSRHRYSKAVPRIDSLNLVAEAPNCALRTRLFLNTFSQAAAKQLKRHEREQIRSKEQKVVSY